jgi:hypothetical protein
VFSGHVFEHGGGWIGPWQELVEASVGVAVDDLCDGGREIGVRINPVELAGLDQRGDHGPMLGTAIGAREQGVLAIECDRTPPRGRDHLFQDLVAGSFAAMTLAGLGRRPGGVGH